MIARPSFLVARVAALALASSAHAQTVVVVTGDISCQPADNASTRPCADRDRRDPASGITHWGTGSLANAINPDFVILLGDIQYSEGQHWQFFDEHPPTCPTCTLYGSFKTSWFDQPNLANKWRPTPGNHEYRDPAATDAGYGAPGYFDMFGHNGSRSIEPGADHEGWYAYDIPTSGQPWRVISMNTGICATDSTVDANPSHCADNSVQTAWLKQELATTHRQCTLAYWHHNVFGSEFVSAGGRHWFQMLADAGVDLALWGHAHEFESFEPVNANCAWDHDGGTGCEADPTGIRSFIVGLGGTDNSGFGACPQGSGKDARCHPNSIVRYFPTDSSNKYNDSFAVMKLTLDDGRYSWEYLKTDGGVITSGSDVCHGPAGPMLGTIAGTVTNLANAQPISSATVTCGDAGTVGVDGSGQYVCGGLQPGTYDVSGAAAGFLPRTYPGVTAAVGVTTQRNLALSTAGKISGTVWAADAGLAGATVTLDGGQLPTFETVMSVSDGTWISDWVAVQPPPYSVTCSKAGYTTQTLSGVAVTPGATTQVSCVLTPTDRAQVNGHVKSAADGSPISGASVTAPTGAATTDALGSYALEVIPGIAGNVTLVASATGFADQTQSVAVVAGATATQDFALALPQGGRGGGVSSGSGGGGGTSAGAGGGSAAGTGGSVSEPKPCGCSSSADALVVLAALLALSRAGKRRRV